MTNKKVRYSIWTAIVCIAASLAVLIFSLMYGTVIDSITTLSVESMKEITQHDQQSIVRSIEMRWEILNNLGRTYSYRGLTKREDMMNALNSEGLAFETVDFGFVASSGRSYTNQRVEEVDGVINKMCSAVKKDDYSGKFMNVYYTDSTMPENKGEIIAFGVQLEPFNIGNITIEYAFCRMEVDQLDNELKIDSYEGKGYSCIFDSEGYYIIRYDRSEDLNTQENFYEDLKGCKLADGITEEYIRNEINSKKIFTIEAVMDGEDRVLRFAPIEDMNLYFVLNVSRSVFDDQSAHISSMILIYFAIMAVVTIGAIVFLFYGMSSAREKKFEILHKHELSEALMKAEAASIAKTTFLNNMSHDIRTPMNAIIGFTDLAVKRIDDKTQTLDCLNKISNSSRHLLRLINDILDMSRIESGKTQWELEVENIESAVENVINMVAGDAEAHGLSFETEVSVTHKTVMCDKLRLTQIMLNLISNAIKYTPSGGSVKVSFTEQPCNKEGFASFCAVVADTGMGMSKEYVQVVFEPFTREKNSTVSGIQGTGLGMAITKNLVDMIGGTITVDSEQGKGSTFTVTFDFEITREEIAESTAEAEEFTFKGERVLLAEDNELNREIAVEILNDADLNVESVENGKEAVDALVAKGKGYYALVLMDVQMPVMDGYEATKAIRRLEDKELAATPILAMTANTFKEDVQDALDAGMDGHIGKPVNIPDLMKAISTIFTRQKND